MERLGMSCAARAIVGEPAPRFTCKAVIDGRIQEVSLASMLATSQWTILVFFPMAWSFICPTEILAFDARRPEFAGCNIFFASCDSEYTLRQWYNTSRAKGGLGETCIPMLSDRNHRLSRDYGVLIEEEGVAQRALFVIDPQGIIRLTMVNDANIGRSVDEVIRVLEALRFVDEYGEGCPADWQKGQSGMPLRFNKAEDKPEGSEGRPGLIRGTSWRSTVWKAARPKTWSDGMFPTTPPAHEVKAKGMVWSRESSLGEPSEEDGVKA